MFEYGNFKFLEADSEDLKTKIFRLRYEVYALEFGFENPDDFPDNFEKDDHDQHSVHFAALNQDDDVIGTIRMILDSPKGFPAEHAADITGFSDKPEPRFITEVSRLTVSKKLRRRPEDGMHAVESYIPQSQGGVSDVKTTDQQFQEKRQKPIIVLGLYKAVYLKCKELGISHMIMITEAKLFHAVYRFGFVFSQVGEPVEYHGKRIPYATSWERIEKHMKERKPDLLGFLLAGLDKKYHPRF
jgi:N-acyl amino acid synthase of PEP-CTERM/exosortase system